MMTSVANFTLVAENETRKKHNTFKLKVIKLFSSKTTKSLYIFSTDLF